MFLTRCGENLCSTLTVRLLTPRFEFPVYPYPYPYIFHLNNIRGRAHVVLPHNPVRSWLPTRTIRGRLSLGVEFMNFNVDYRLLFADLKDQTYEDAFAYYATFYHAPIGVRVRANQCAACLD